MIIQLPLPLLSPEQALAEFEALYPGASNNVPDEHLGDLVTSWQQTSVPIIFRNGRVIGPLGSDAPFVVSYGMGTDSTAELIKLHEVGVVPDAILFSDVGDEMPHTYAYLPIIQDWLAQVGFPPVTVVRYKPKRFKWHVYNTLGGNCLANRTLPSLAFGRKSCSLKWKGEVLDRWVHSHYPGRTYRAIGYDCGNRDSRRFATATARNTGGVDLFVYPLHIWRMSRPDCQDVIATAGLPDPGKSSCHFCPAMKNDEVAALPPEQLWRIVIIEANAQPKLHTIRGLWRNRRMTDFILHTGLLPIDGVNEVWQKWSSLDRIVVDKTAVAETVLENEVAYFMEKYPIPA